MSEDSDFTKRLVLSRNNRLLERAERAEARARDAEARVRDMEDYHMKALAESAEIIDNAVVRIKILEERLLRHFGKGW